MIFPAVGVPGRFAEQCENLLCRLVAASGVEPVFIGASTLSEAGAKLLAQDSLHAVMVVRRPSSDLVQAILASGKPFFVAVEPPRACVAALMADHGNDLLDAVRATASAGSAILPLMQAPGALILRAGESELEAVAARIAAHYGLDVPQQTIADIAASVARDLPSPASLSAPTPAGQPEPADAPFDPGFSRMLPDLMAGTLDPVWRALDNGLQELHWHRDLFRASDHPQGPLPPVLDVTGLGRCLVYGPYIHIPPGSWSVSLMLGCCARARGLKMIAEIASGDAVLGRVSFVLTEAGFFEIEFASVVPSQDHPVEIRLFLAEAAFEGQLALIQATLKPLRATRVPVKLV